MMRLASAVVGLLSCAAVFWAIGAWTAFDFSWQIGISDWHPYSRVLLLVAFVLSSVWFIAIARDIAGGFTQ